jgi:hypothetical protein
MFLYGKHFKRLDRYFKFENERYNAKYEIPLSRKIQKNLKIKNILYLFSHRSNWILNYLQEQRSQLI